MRQVDRNGGLRPAGFLVGLAELVEEADHALFGRVEDGLAQARDHLALLDAQQIDQRKREVGVLPHQPGNAFDLEPQQRCVFDGARAGVAGLAQEGGRFADEAARPMMFRMDSWPSSLSMWTWTLPVTTT